MSISPAPPPFDSLSHDRQMAILAEVAHAALARYGLASASAISLINISENATYRIEASGRRFALRVHRDGYHTDEAIRSELAWAVALRADGIATTPVPVPGENGDLIQKISHPALHRPRNVVLFEWEMGSEPGLDDDLSGPFATLGEVTARMHRHAQIWKKPAGFERHRWDFETSLGDRPHWGRWRDGMGVDHQTANVFAETVDLIRHRLAAFGTGADRFDLVHGDLRLANLLVDGSAVKVIDFDDSGFSWFMYDAATPVSFYEHRPEVPQLIRSWLDGYRRVIDLPQADEDEIPTFIMLRRLLLVAWIGSHSQTDLAREMGNTYTRETVPLCRTYLRDFG